MPPTLQLTRRTWLKSVCAAAAATLMPIQHSRSQAVPIVLTQRRIPRSGEMLPVIGLGTYLVFDVAPGAPETEELKQVLKLFVAAGGRLVDSSPMYGRAESAVGALAAEAAVSSSLFLATKVWTNGRQSGIDQMRASLRNFRASRIDLMQVHNLLDLQTHLGTLREWKRAGAIRYLGITHYHKGAYGELEKHLSTRDYDFVQFNYSLAERDAETRLLDVAADTGTAVIINRPFAQGELFANVKGRQLPAWAAEFDCESWAQFFLKYILAHPAVTCVIPGTGKPRHIEDNLRAGTGRLPDAAMKRRMVEFMRT